jgi:type I restriction enzyme S subunit
LSLTKVGVIVRDLENSKGKFPEFFNSYKIIRKNDLIFCLYDIEETPRTIGLSGLDGMITGSYNVFQTNQVPKFIYYWYLTIDDVKGLKPFYTGMRNVVRNETFMSLKIFTPPLHEQHQIVKYLDYKTSIIDKLISTKERKIELLKEQRSSLINEVITKGLDPNVKMKDSGVKWIGEIPIHWERTKLKRYVSIFTGYSFKSEWFGEIGIPVVRISNIQDGYIDFTKSVFLTENYLTRFPDYILEENDTLICLTGSLTGKVGKFNHKVGLLNQRVGKIKVKGEIVKKDFVDIIFFFPLFQKIIKKMGEGISENFPNVSHLDVVELEIPLPPVQEQEDIIEFLERNNKEIDELVHLEQKKIELLKEYRQSLISEVITGKIKVVE